MFSGLNLLIIIVVVVTVLSFLVNMGDIGRVGIAAIMVLLAYKLVYGTREPKVEDHESTPTTPITRPKSGEDTK